MEISNLKLPITFNCTITENIDTIYRLEDYTILKEDISSLNKKNIEENGLIIINKEYVRIESKYCIQNFPYHLIKEIKTTNEQSQIWNITLNNGETITIYFNSTDENIEESKKFIIQNINKSRRYKSQNNSTNNNQPNNYNLNNKTSGIDKIKNFIKKEKIITIIIIIATLLCLVFIYSSTVPFTLEDFDSKQNYNTGSIYPTTTTYTKIRINTFDYIHSIRLEYHDSNGKFISGGLLDNKNAWIEGNHIYVYGNSTLMGDPAYCEISIQHGSSYYKFNQTIT